MPGLMIDPRDPRYRALPRTMRTLPPPPSMSIPPSGRGWQGSQPLQPPMDMPPGAQAPSTGYNPLYNMQPPMDTPPEAQASSTGYNPLYNMQQQPPAEVPVEQPAPEEPATPTEEKWSASGKTDSFGSFFNKRSSTDALTAFGAAMLKAPTFMQGLGDAALAVNAVDRENRMPTEEEIAKANIKARMASGKGAFSPKILQQGYDSRGGNWTQVLSSDGTPLWYGPGNVTTTTVPEGFRDRANSGMGRDANNSSDALAKDQELIATAPDNIARYEQMKRIAMTSGSGTGLFAGISRGLSTLTGKNFPGTDLAQMQEYEKMASTGELEAAISQKGLGQLTEGEREIIRRSVPTISTDPEAAKVIMDVFIARERRLLEMADEWEAADLAPNQYKAWKNKFLRDWDKEHGGVYKEGNAPGTNDSPASLLDEADAIVN